jgi:hypothetical protein
MINTTICEEKLGRPRLRWEDIIKIDLEMYGVKLWSGLCSL